MRRDDTLPLRDKLYMLPIDKYEVHGRFPWKLVIHLFLVVLTSLQVVLILIPVNSYSIAQITNWNKLFLNRDASADDTSLVFNYNIFSFNDLESYISWTSKNYYNVNEHTIDEYELPTEDGQTKQIEIWVEYTSYDATDAKAYDYSYKLEMNGIGELYYYSPKEFLSKVKRFQLTFKIRHKVSEYLQLPANCFEWQLTQNYDYSMHGLVVVSLRHELRECDPSFSDFLDNYLWLNVLVLTLGFASLVLTWKHLTLMSVTIAQMAHRQTTAAFWNRLLFRDKLKFFNLWTVVSIVGNLFQMFGAVVSFISSVSRTLSLVIGFGCFLAWINIIRYMVQNSESYVAIKSLRYSSEMLLPYMVGVVPIYMGFVFLGMSLFWSSGIFTNLYESMATTFALMQADSFYSTMSALEQVNYFLGMLYTIAFTLFFICVVQNIFIAIIVQSYQVTKNHSHTHEIDDASQQVSPSSPSPLIASPRTQISRQEARLSRRQQSMKVFRNLVTGDSSPQTLPLEQAKELDRALRLEIEDILREMKAIRDERRFADLDARVRAFLDEQLPSMIEFFK